MSPPEAQRDIYKVLLAAGNVFEVAFKEARAKAREARFACGYDPAMSEAIGVDKAAE